MGVSLWPVGPTANRLPAYLQERERNTTQSAQSQHTVSTQSAQRAAATRCDACECQTPSSDATQQASSPTQDGCVAVACGANSHPAASNLQVKRGAGGRGHHTISTLTVTVSTQSAQRAVEAACNVCKFMSNANMRCHPTGKPPNRG
jgi:hypothetical protein